MASESQYWWLMLQGTPHASQTDSGLVLLHVMHYPFSSCQENRLVERQSSRLLLLGWRSQLQYLWVSLPSAQASIFRAIETSIKISIVGIHLYEDIVIISFTLSARISREECAHACNCVITFVGSTKNVHVVLWKSCMQAWEMADFGELEGH